MECYKTYLEQQQMMCFQKYDNETITDKYSTPNTSNNFFVNVGSDLAKRIPDSLISPYSYMETEIVNSIFLETFSPEELL